LIGQRTRLRVVHFNRIGERRGDIERFRVGRYRKVRGPIALQCDLAVMREIGIPRFDPLCPGIERP
jgi:hypothetical protein